MKKQIIMTNDIGHESDSFMFHRINASGLYHYQVVGEHIGNRWKELRFDGPTVVRVSGSESYYAPVCFTDRAGTTKYIMITISPEGTINKTKSHIIRRNT